MLKVALIICNYFKQELHCKVEVVLQMASGDMEVRVKSKFGVAADQPIEWHYKPCTFSPVVRKLILGSDETLGILGSRVNGDVY